MSCQTGQNGGQIKDAVRLSKSLVRTTGNIASDLATGLANTIGGITNGIEMVAQNVGNALNELSKNLEITSTKIISRVGGLGIKVANDLGKVVKVVPILGQPVAYVVKGSGRGVYYVVTTVGHIVGKGIRTVGKVGHGATDLVVFTIASTSTATEETIKEAGNIVKNVTSSLTNTRNKSNKSKKVKKGGKLRKSTSKPRKSKRNTLKHRK